MPEAPQRGGGSAVKISTLSSEKSIMSIMRVRSFLSTFLAIAVALPLASRAAEPAANVESSRAFLADLIKLSELSREKKGQKDAGAKQLVQSLSQRVDFSALALRSLGKARWNGLKPQERKDFLALLQELLEEVVYPQARKISSKTEALSFRADPAQKDRVLIEGTIEREKRGEIVSTELKVGLIYDAKTAKLVDALIEKEQISANLKRQFDAALKKQTFAQVLAKLKKRVQDAKSSSTGDGQRAVAS
jgi:ABC-type transporter MlaC component